MDYNRQLLDFIKHSPSAYHAVDNVKKALESAGFERLEESGAWTLKAPGRYYVERNGSAIIAFRVPREDYNGFMIMAAHSDSPTFRIKEKPETVSAGAYTRLNIEKYGWMICSTWLDRPLSAAGRVMVEENGRIISRLADVDRDLLMIPSVAIHMDRTVNDGKKFDANVDMLPIMGGAEQNRSFAAIVADSAGVTEDSIIAMDMQLYPRTEGAVWGAENEYVSSPRLDDLQCVFGCMNGLINAKDGDSAGVLAVFDNEEVGSGTLQGADSTFLRDVLARCCRAFGVETERAMANSFMVSADNAHAVHPNHPEYADRNDRPLMNGGIVIKYNAARKYATDSLSAAVFMKICDRAGVPYQRFTNRADLPGGSTLGNISSAHVSVSTVDIGLPQLAMHSAYETAGAKDTAYLVKAAEEFYACSFRRDGDSVLL